MVLFPYRVPGVVQPSVTAVVCLEFGLTQTFRMVIYRGLLWMEQLGLGLDASEVEVLEGVCPAYGP